MGILADGKWVDRWYDTKSQGGRFARQPSAFRKHVGGAEHPSEVDRYHLYVSLACPWAHRTLIARKLKGIECGVSVVHPEMLENGWEFRDEYSDPLHGARYLYELYLKADPRYEGRVTVPVLWDKRAGTIVNNESSEILRIFDQELGKGRKPELYPAALRERIDAINTRVYDDVNNGVYKAGFATTQEAYDEAVSGLFDALEWLESSLEGHRYLAGDRLTEADIRLFTTLIRFDAVYAVHFKCSKKRILDYPNLWAFTRRIYQTPGVRETVDFDHIRRHYYYSHPSINPHRIVAAMPALDLDAPAD